MAKRLLDYVLKGGIKNRFFVQNEHPENLQIYQVRGV